ncbi:MAG TPA: decarboxylating 6-phosphogluconate dehydrogenase [Streptosporangiaceae bacterium]
MATDKPMQLGMVGLGRMGANLVRRLMRDGHHCVVYDISADAVKALEDEGAKGSTDLATFVNMLDTPRNVWLMIPAGLVEPTLDKLKPMLAKDDTIIDGGNSYYRDDIIRSKALKEQGIHYVDCGTSGGIWGLERGYCLMIGGDDTSVNRLDPIFKTIAPGQGMVPATPSIKDTDSTADQGYLHCGPSGAGHFVKMIHNGIEYGMMAAIAEGLSILEHADIGSHMGEIDAETTPLRDPWAYQYDIPVGDVAEVWRRGSVISSWLIDLTADAFAKSPDLSDYSGRVSDSGEGRWTVEAAIDTGVPAPVISSALYERFESRGDGKFTGQVLSAMRSGFGGHQEKKAD